MSRRRARAALAAWCLTVALFVLGAPTAAWAAFAVWLALMAWPIPSRPSRPSIADLPTRKSPDPIRGVKLGWVVMDAGQVRFMSLVRGNVVYGADEQARCLWLEAYAAPLARGRAVGVIGDTGAWYLNDHGPVPEVSCTCGFYAWKRRLPTRRMMPTLGLRRPKGFRRTVRAVVLLDVELLGRVICCEQGYRASHQRVLSVSVRRRCITCGRRARGMAGSPFFAAPDSPSALVPTCGCQQPVRWSLVDLANMAGTEFRWDRKPLLTKLGERRRVAS